MHTPTHGHTDRMVHEKHLPGERMKQTFFIIIAVVFCVVCLLPFLS
jgi:hypothetical protein